jgi:CRP-like cAMP-binding protein
VLKMLTRSDTDEYRALERLPMYPHLSSRHRRLLRALTTFVQVDAGREILTEDRPRGRESFMVVAGEASVSRHGVEQARLGPGDVFGELGALGVRRQNATVTAQTDMTLLQIEPADLVRLMDEVLPFADQVYGVYAGR